MQNIINQSVFDMFKYITFQHFKPIFIDDENKASRFHQYI